MTKNIHDPDSVSFGIFFMVYCKLQKYLSNQIDLPTIFTLSIQYASDVQP